MAYDSYWRAQISKNMLHFNGGSGFGWLILYKYCDRIYVKSVLFLNANNCQHIVTMEQHIFLQDVTMP